MKEVPKYLESQNNPRDIMHNQTHFPGTYVDLRFGIELCQKYHLDDLERLIHQTYKQYQPPFPAREVLLGGIDISELWYRENEFLQVSVDVNPITIRKADSRVNGTQILKEAGRGSGDMTKIRHRGEVCFDIVRGPAHIQGTYVEFTYGLELCDQHGLHKLARLLQTAKQSYQHKAVVNVDSSVSTPVLAGQHDSKGADFGLSPSRLDKSWEGSARAEDSEPQDFEDSRDAEELQELQKLKASQNSDEIGDEVGLEGKDDSKDQRSCNALHLKSWKTGHLTVKTIDDVSPSSTSVNRLDQRSVFTEPSYSRGSFLQPGQGSFLRAVDPDLLYQHQSHPSPLYYVSVSDLAPAYPTQSDCTKNASGHWRTDTVEKS